MLKFQFVLDSVLKYNPELKPKLESIMEPKVKLEFRSGFEFKICKESKTQARPQGSKHYIKDLSTSARVDEPPLRNQAFL